MPNAGIAMKTDRRLTLAVLVLACAIPLAGQQTQDTGSSSVPITRFAGTWVGTQKWAIANPPPGSRQDQPVTLTLDVADGKVVGSMKPFLGGDEGATIIEAKMVGDELHASAIVGRPRPAGARRGAAPVDAGASADAANPPGRGAPPQGWKESVKVSFVFRNNGLNTSGTADVVLGEVQWMKFSYELEKKRSRY
jgi:hypothetical protein